MRRGPIETKYEISGSKSSSGNSNSGKVVTSPSLSSISSEDEELLKALDSISRLRKGFVHLQVQQLRDRRRLNLYSENNKTNRNEMFIASIAETAVFVIAALFQIYFVRTWFANRAKVIAQNGNRLGSTKLSA